MRNFLKIAESVDVIPLLNALAAKEHLWNQNDLRTTHPMSPHQECDDIWLAFNRIPANDAEIVDDLDVMLYPAWAELPQARGMIFDLMRRVEAVRLGRVIITRLAPGCSIPPHVDEGAPATYYTRYQIALQCQPGATFRIGEEVIQFHMGEVWQINNRVEHEVTNNSGDDRLVLIVDLRLC